MRAFAQHVRGDRRAALVARATAWLLDPPVEPRSRRGDPRSAEPRPAPLRAVPPPPDPPRPIVAVLGLTPRAGASTIARALAARLATTDPAGAAILITPDTPRAALRTAAGTRLARALGGEDVRVAGRVCVLPAAEPLAPLAARRLAPVVADVEHGTPAEGATALADHVVLVAPPDVDLPLAAAVETALRSAGHMVTLVANRALADPPEELAHALVVPEARVAAQLTLACREPRGALAVAAAELAERSLAEVVR